jgi:glycosyltransferase involved in cell wall biosynthesis
MKLGIGITTRNRIEVLDHSLANFTKYTDDTQEILVVDDNSDIDSFSVLGDRYPDIDFIYNKERKGVAKSKNVIISEFQNKDGVILFDDDCFPIQPGWTQHFIKGCIQHDQHHMIFAQEPQITIERRFEYVDAWLGCLGVCIFLSRKAIKTIGGFDPKFGLYGFEHHELTGRCYAAKLSPMGVYVTPKNMSEYIWSSDLRGDHEGFKWPCKGCMSEEEKIPALDYNNRVSVDIMRNPQPGFYRKFE